MPWEFTEDVALYADHAWDLLASRPLENTIALTVIENARADPKAGPSLYGWFTGGGQVRGAVSVTPPDELLVADVPDRSVDGLVAALRARDVQVPGVRGDTFTVDRFAGAWITGHPLRATTTLRQRLYVMGTLRSPAPRGRARPAGEADTTTAVRWFEEFHREIAAHALDPYPIVRDRIAAGRLWVWEHAGAAVAMAARNRPAAGVARVGPVYTPPEHRRHGYGAAVTAACTDDALRREADMVVLYTDLANPTSNKIYQSIGYGPIRDEVRVHFTRS